MNDGFYFKKKEPGFSFPDTGPQHARVAWENHHLNRMLKATDWSVFERSLRESFPRSEGAFGWDPLMLFRCLLLAEWNSLDDRALEEALAFRLDFRLYAGVPQEKPAPDRTAFASFRERLELRWGELLEMMDDQLATAGITARRSSPVDADHPDRTWVTNAIREHERELQILIDTSPVPIVVYDTNGIILYLNRKFVDLFGYTHEDVPDIERWWPRAYPDAAYREEVRAEWNHRAVNAAKERGELVPMETTVTCADGSSRYAEFRLSSTGKKYFVAVTDLTERKIAEDALRESVREKEVLLRELYHRTQNNMQVICSLLSLQCCEEKNAALQDVYTGMQTKIQTMALVHLKLYESQDLCNINLQRFIASLVELIEKSHELATARVSIRHSIDSVPVYIDIATPLGLVMNELMTNSIRHAFPGGGGGTIEIAMRQQGDTLAIDYADDGTGPPAGFDPARATSLGMQLIMTIVRQQLMGDISFTGGSGFGCRILVKTNLYVKRILPAPG